ncbi:MAG: hypothetical protein QOF48_967 [Verrucomicrobiota bacterium]|jgi:type II secretory pathway component PulK
MKTISRLESFGRPLRRQNGSSVLVILVLLACMVMLISANTSTLHTLRQELKRIDKEQQKKFSPHPLP